METHAGDRIAEEPLEVLLSGRHQRHVEGVGEQQATAQVTEPLDDRRVQEPPCVALAARHAVKQRALLVNGDPRLADGGSVAACRPPVLDRGGLRELLAWTRPRRDNPPVAFDPQLARTTDVGTHRLTPAPA